ncbi:MAG: SRPBCC family protein [bacterium]
MAKKMLLGLAALIGLFFLTASFQPDQFTFSRSIFVEAKPSVCFGLVDNFHNWRKWSPWAQMDPGMQVAYDGPISGVGARYVWSGNGKVGAGKMAMVKARKPSVVDINLEFLRPMKGSDLAEFTFNPKGPGTQVTWTMSGPLNLLEKAVRMVYDTDKMLAPDFERGLTQLKAAAEASKK